MIEKETENTTPAAEIQTVDARYTADCRDWANQIAVWSLKAKTLRDERMELDAAMNSIHGRAVIALMKAGMKTSEAERHIETLLERAFTA